MAKKNNKRSRKSAEMNLTAKRKRIVMWVVIAVAAGLIAYGSCIGANVLAG